MRTGPSKIHSVLSFQVAPWDFDVTKPVPWQVDSVPSLKCRTYVIVSGWAYFVYLDSKCGGACRSSRREEGEVISFDGGTVYSVVFGPHSEYVVIERASKTTSADLVLSDQDIAELLRPEQSGVVAVMASNESWFD